MIPVEYIDKIFDKIGKAKLANALNIADEIKEKYSVDDLFSQLVEKSKQKCLPEAEKSAKVCCIVNKWQTYYNSEFNYNKNMILDNFIMELCESMRKY